MNRKRILGVIGGLALVGVACASASGGREVLITQTDTDCTPSELAAATGEKLSFVIKNEGTKDKEIEGIDGTKLQELEVPKGKTRTVSWTAPSAATTAKLKCYIPGGATTIISIAVS